MTPLATRVPPSAIVVNSSTPLWYLTRATGLVALVLLTASMSFGLLASVRYQRPAWPRFVTAGLHQNSSLLAPLAGTGPPRQDPRGSGGKSLAPRRGLRKYDKLAERCTEAAFPDKPQGPAGGQRRRPDPRDAVPL